MERGKCRNCGEPKNDGRCPKCIITGVRLEIKMPLNCTWDELGARLRGLRTISHRLLNAGMLGLVADLHMYESKKRTGTLKKGEKLKLYSYPHILAERTSFAEWARNKATKLRGLEQERVNSLAVVASSVPGDILAYANKTVDDKFRRWMKNRTAERLPMYKGGAPILLPNCEVISVGNSVQLSLKLASKGKCEIAAVPVSGSAWQSMKWVSTKEAKTGDCKLIYDEYKKKWFALLTVIRPRPEPPAISEGVVLAVNRGRTNFLYCVANDGRNGHVLWPGSDILNFKKQIRARMLQLKNMRHHRGSGSRGHGKKRFFKVETNLESYEKNFVHTVCQQVTAELDRRATMIGAGTVLIEDFNTIEKEDLRYIESWPWYQLKQSIAWMCEKTGRKLIEQPSAYISSVCPRCQNEDVSQTNIRTGMFHCSNPGCSYANASDFVACLSQLGSSDADMTAWFEKFKAGRRLEDT